MELEKLLNKYDYRLPPALIAQTQAKPRDSARLLVYNRKSQKTAYDQFVNLGKYLPKNAVLVLNQTKVWPARLIAQKSTGGKIELLYISRDKRLVKVLANKKLNIGSHTLIFRGREKSKYGFVTKKKTGQFYYLKPDFPLSETQSILQKYGVTPLPPYIKHSPLTEKQKRRQYQSVFSKSGLSVAAPTASLHFTKSLLANLRRQGIDIKFVRLDVGLGTFAPLGIGNLKTDKLHKEYYYIDKQTAAFLNRAKAGGRPIIAVGTTVIRTLESACSPSPLARGDAPNASEGQRGRTADIKLTKLAGATDLFIHDNYQFKFVDGLITNFHVPKSSLLMLVSAFADRKSIFNLYRRAIRRRFRFFSFGDGMLIL